MFGEKIFNTLKNHTQQQSFRRIGIPCEAIRLFDQLFFFSFENYILILVFASTFMLNSRQKFLSHITSSTLKALLKRQKIHHSKSSAVPSIRLKILTDMILYENHIFTMVKLRMTLNSVSIVMFRSCLFMVGVGECNNIGATQMEHLLGICLFFRFRQCKRKFLNQTVVVRPYNFIRVKSILIFRNQILK